MHLYLAVVQTATSVYRYDIIGPTIIIQMCSYTYVPLNLLGFRRLLQSFSRWFEIASRTSYLTHIVNVIHKAK